MMKLLRLIQCFTLVGVALLAAQTDAVYAENTTTTGKDFFLAIPQANTPPPQIALVITTPFSSASYKVETSTGLIATGVVDDEVDFVTLSNNLQVDSSGYSNRNKGIRVRATGRNPIFVFVFTRFSTYLPLAIDSFKLHQNVETNSIPATYEYFALSTDYNGQSLNRRSEVLLIANHNDTIVSITPTQTVSLPQDAQDPSSALVNIAPGSTHNVTLNQFQTLLVFNPTHDITGTRIVSNKPLTVITGHQCAQFPTDTPFCEPVHVQLPPTFIWGQEFLIAPFAGRNTPQQIKLVTAKNSTTIVYRCGDSTAIGRTLPSTGQGEYLNFPAGLYCSLFATKPIFVVQLGASHLVDDTGDPVMAVVSPTTRHINSTFFIVDTLVFPFSYISITILPEHFGNNKSILLDGNELTCYWYEIYNTSGLAGHGCNISTTNGRHNISHSEVDGLMSVVAYGWSNSPAWGNAFLAGMSLEIFESTDTSIPDLQTDDTLKFFDLSSFTDLRELPRELEVSSPPIYLPGYLIYGNHAVKSVYVNENGLFSFDKSYKFSHPNRFPTDNIYSRLRDTVAPFWSDNDIRKNGTVRYVDIVKGSEGNYLLEETAAYVRNTLLIEEFRPTWMIVAQWDKVHPHPHGADSHEGFSEEFLGKTNKYQGIIITDRVHTYSLFTYTCGELQWSAHGLEYAVVGYNCQGDYFSNNPASGYENIADVVSCSFQVTGKRRRRQTIIDSINDFTMTMEMPADSEMQKLLNMCLDLINIDNNSITISDVPIIVDKLPVCPPSYYQVNVDLLFEKDSTRQGCFQSKVQHDPSESGIKVQRDYRFVQQCCYLDRGGLITSGIEAGSLLDTVNPNQFESSMFNSCCVNLPDTCNQYRMRRPISDGTNYEAPHSGLVYGDPHYITLDGATHYFFGGKGKYTLLEVGEILTLQAEIIGFWPLSVAFGILDIESYQLREGSSELYSTTNKNNPHIISFTDGIYEGDLFTIQRKLKHSQNVVFEVRSINHIVFKMDWTIQMLQRLEIQIPQSLCQNPNISIHGHLGNCDGIIENDLRPDSADQITNMSELLFGNFENDRKRRQTTNQTLNCAVCGNNTVPKFEDFTFTNAQRQLCNNLTSCLFDLAVTGNEAIAANTRDFEINGTRIAEILNNNLPAFSASEVFNVTVGIENIYTFNVTDSDDNFTVTIKEGAPNGGKLVNNGNGMYTFQWTVTTSPTSGVFFQAEDARGAVVLHSPLLHVCSCFNGGECTLDGATNTDILIQMTCICTEAYDGDSCSEDRNGCSEIECFEGVECLDVPAPGVGAVCGPCPTGYTGDGLKCFDINECLEDSSLCDQVCENTVGSYTCNCHTGFMLIGNQCQDIDECSGINNCQQECNNTVGSYVCSCQLGFILNSDNMTCTAQQVCTGTNSCSHICAVIGGMETCFCPVGLELNTTTCIDINECDRFSPCDQVCINSVGSFMCSCESGYELEEDMRTCTDIDECQNAALSNTELCFNNTQCLNTGGSYNCTCVPGYKLVNNTCERHIETPPEVQIAPPPKDGAENLHIFVIETYTKTELTSEKIQDFRVATAKAITRFCEPRECSLITHNQERKLMGLTVEPQNIAVPVTLITVNSDGKPVLTFYVQLNSTTFVTAATVSMAVESADDLYRNAGFFLQDLCNEHTPCQNGATCTNTARGYTCACVTGYTGKNCSVDIDDCASNPCQNGGTCTDGANRFECACPPNMMGDQCEEQAIDLQIIGIAIGAMAALFLILFIVLLVLTYCCIQKTRHAKIKRDAKKTNGDFEKSDHVFANPIYCSADQASGL